MSNPAAIETPTMSRRLRAVAVALFASALLAGSVTPSSAFSTRSTAHTAHTLGYGAAPAGMLGGAAVPEDRMVDDATAYCLDRYKSYDPESGTYLGYDGVERFCP